MRVLDGRRSIAKLESSATGQNQRGSLRISISTNHPPAQISVSRLSGRALELL